MREEGFLEESCSVTCAGGTNSISEADSAFRALFPALSSGWDLCSEDLRGE